MSMRNYRWLAVLCALLSGPVCAQGLSLWQFYQQAQQGDMRYAESRATYAEAKTLGAAARSAFLPKVTLDANTTYNELTNHFLGGLPGFAFPSGTFDFNSNGYGLMVTQALFDVRAIDAYEAAGSTVRAARYRAELAHTELILAVARAYFGLLLAQSELHLAHAEQRALEIEMRSARHSFHLGTASITDTNEASARYDVVTAQALKAENAVRIARNRMMRMTNQPVQNLWRVNLADLPKPPPVNTLADALARARHDSLTLAVARAQARAAGAQARAAVAAHFPRIEAVASYDYARAGNSIYGFGNVSRQKSIGIDLTWPIYQGGELEAASAKAAARARKARYTLERAQRLVRYNVHQGFLNVRSAYAQIRALETAERASRTALASERLGARIGIRSNVDVLAAQQQLYSAKRALAAAVFGYLMSRLELTAAISHLAPADLRRLNRRLLPPRGSRQPIRAGATTD
ncbi:MAG: TolC family outer membrane protein [Gammaproteobacteria bacterium]|nr:TolC family outer membrane protein [Gammaproteobacteria bacterium]